MNRMIEWKNAPDFHEFAEALAIETSQILAVNFGDDPGTDYLVLYTPENDPTIWTAYVSRDSDGVLQLTSVRKPRPGLREKLDLAVNTAMAELEEERPDG